MSQLDVADAPLDRVVDVVKSMNESRVGQSRGQEAAQAQRLRLDLLACEVDLLRFDLGVQVERQAKLVALAIARERFERVLTTDATDGHG